MRRTGALDDVADAWLDAAATIGTDRNLTGVLALVASVRA
jgi:hypothetical protein